MTQRWRPERSGEMRDLVGYGKNLPRGRWSNGKRLAVNIALNYEEGSEKSLLEGDEEQESGTEWGQYAYPASIRNLAMESMYEYGSRVGVWRILGVLDEFSVPCTVFACAVAVERNPEFAAELRRGVHEVCSHGYRWEEVFRLTEQEEAEHIEAAQVSFERTIGYRPVGWYCRYGPSERTRRLLAARDEIVYDSDSYADDVPYYVDEGHGPRLVVPYAPDSNDFRFWQANGPATASAFLEYLTDAFDVLHAEAQDGPRMMSLGLHTRIIGRPGRIEALRGFLAHVSAYGDVWITTRRRIAEDWLRMHPPVVGQGS